MVRVLVAFDIGGSKISFVAREVGSARDVHANKVKTPADDGLEAVLDVLDQQIDELPGGSASVAAIGVAVAGRVDAEGRVLVAGNLRGWVDVPLRALLEKRHGVPVFVERDANCGALGEKWCGVATDMEDFVFLSLGTGVGAGLFLEGRLRRGAHFAAGEAGDVSFPDEGDTLGGVLSKRLLAKAVKRATGEKMSADEALSRARREPRLERATRRPVAYLGSAVSAISALLDPEAIVVGGGTSEAGEALLRRVRGQVPRDLSRTRLILAGLGTQSPLYGALWGAGEVRRRVSRPSRWADSTAWEPSPARSRSGGGSRRAARGRRARGRK
jgi:glucokinase